MTSSFVLPAAWAALTAMLLAPRRPRARLAVAGRRRPRSSPVSRLGRAVLGLVRRRGDDESTARLVGWSVIAAFGTALIVPPLAVVPVVIAVVVPRVRVRRAARAEDETVDAALPDLVDLLALASGSGLPLVPALTIVGPHAPEPLSGRIASARERIEHGAQIPVALTPIAAGSTAAAGVVRLLVASERDGSPLADPLHRLADDLRADARRRAETRARRVPVRLLFPLVGCTLPAFVLVTVVPPVIAALGSVDL